MSATRISRMPTFVSPLIRGRQAKVGAIGKVGHPHHSKYGEGYGKNDDASF